MPPPHIVYSAGNLSEPETVDRESVTMSFTAGPSLSPVSAVLFHIGEIATSRFLGIAPRNDKLKFDNKDNQHPSRERMWSDELEGGS
jgi:hypothetical protein